MAIKLPSLTETPKTEHGATVGSIGQGVDDRTQTFLDKKRREGLIQRAKEEALERMRKSPEEGSGRTR